MVGPAGKPWRWRLGVIAVVALGAVNFLWQLGSSSLYVDEVLSIDVARSPLAHFLHAVSTLEITPPGYFLFLHEWILRLGSPDLDWVYRLPSALAGVAAVGAIAWLARVALPRGRAAPWLAGGLCALSPFMLEHAQQAQGYVFVTLGATLAVAAALAARGSPRRTILLTASLLAALLAVLAHYVALLVIVPLCVWVAMTRTFPRAWRATYCVACGLLVVALVPLVIAQHHSFPQRVGVQSSAALTISTLESLASLPFDGRVSPLRILGVALIVVAIAVGVRLVLRDRRSRSAEGHLGLVAVLAVAGPVVLTVLSALGGNGFWGHLMLTRYAAASAPFAILLIVAAALALPRPFTVLLSGGAAAVMLVGSVQSHRPQGFFLDARHAVAAIRAGYRPGDAVLLSSTPAAEIPLVHYGIDAEHPQLIGQAAAQAIIAGRRRRVWIVFPIPSGTSALLTEQRTLLQRLGYHVLQERLFPATTPLLVILAVPGAG